MGIVAYGLRKSTSNLNLLEKSIKTELVNCIFSLNFGRGAHNIHRKSHKIPLIILFSLYVAGLELAYIYAPRPMQSIIMALFWFCQGIGALVGLGTISAFQHVWFSSYDHGNINCKFPNDKHCHLDYYFYCVAALQVVGMVAFMLATWVFGIGRSIPVRVQRDGCTMIRPQRDDASSTFEIDTANSTPTLSDSINRLRSRSLTFQE